MGRLLGPGTRSSRTGLTFLGCILGSIGRMGLTWLGAVRGR